MKFRLVENLTEEMVYRIDYVDKNNKKDYFYMIGNDSNKNSIKYENLGDIIQFLKNQIKNNETVNMELFNKLPDIVRHKVSIITDKTQQDKSFASNKYINTTHRTARDHSMLGKSFSGYITHHMDGNEENFNSSNLLGISQTGQENLIHQLLHMVNFNRQKLNGSSTYDVLVWDPTAGTHIRKDLYIEVKVL